MQNIDFVNFYSLSRFRTPTNLHLKIESINAWPAPWVSYDPGIEVAEAAHTVFILYGGLTL